LTRKLRLRLDDDTASRLEKLASAGGYSSAEELVLHMIEREIAQLDPRESESVEEIRRKLEGLGYME
jgi:hypothetical protein